MIVVYLFYSAAQLLQGMISAKLSQKNCEKNERRTFLIN